MKLSLVGRTFEGSLDNLRDGAAIGISGEVAIAAIEAVEKLLGKPLPTLSKNEELNRAAKAEVAAMLLKNLAPMMGEKATALQSVARHAERYARVILGKLGAELIIPTLNGLLSKTEGLVKAK